MNPQILIQKSQESLEAVEILITHEKFNVSASRAYYAALQMTWAAILFLKLPVKERSHGKAINLLENDLVHRMELRNPSALRLLRGIREDADYSDHPMSRTRAEGAFQTAADITRTIHRQILTK